MAADSTRSGHESHLARNPVSFAGAWLTTLSVFAFLTYLAFEYFGLIDSPYAGIFGFMIVPAFFILGLLLIPIGIWNEGRRRAHGRAAWRWPLIDLGHRRTRVWLTVIGALTVVNLGIVAIASVGAVHYSESNEFCGQLCHVPMTPEFSTHKLSSHAAVKCVQCHVVPTAQGFIQAKMNGTRQLWELATSTYSRPIIHARDRIPVPSQTCENCHSPIPPDREIKQVLREHKDNETSSEITTTLTVYAGKNHWHSRPGVQIEYAATDNTLATIPYVKVIENGRTTEYLAEGVTAPPEGQPIRHMNCLDCHNRPAHPMTSTAAQVVDRAIVRGEISKSVPFVRGEMVEALAEEVPAGTDNSAAIQARLTKAFGTSTPEARQAVEVALRLYRENVFPAMKITWGTYRNDILHVDDTGCFRCHNDTHTAKGDPEKKLSQSCELCHKEE